MTPTSPMPTIARRGPTILAGVALGVLAMACADRPPTGVYGETTNLIQQVRSDLKALNMSPGESRKVTPKAYDAGGAEMTDSVTVRYTSSSTTRVTVDADGTIHASAITEEPVSVIVAGTRGQVTQFDTVFVNVIAPPPAPATKLAMYFDGDSLGLGAGGSNLLNGALITGTGDTLSDVLVVFTIKDAHVATPARYQRFTYIRGVSPGKTWVYGTATLGASTFLDSLPIHVGWAAEAYMNWTYQGRWGLAGTNIVLQPNGVIYFNNFNGDTKSEPITFDDPSAAEAEFPGGPSGNIPAFASGSNPRRFTKVGTYIWRSKDVEGKEQIGQVTVKPNPT